MRNFEGKVRLQYVGMVNGIKAKNIKVGDVLRWNGGGTSVVKSIEFTKTRKSVKIVEVCEGREFDRTMRSERLVAIAKFANNEEAKEIEEIKIGSEVIANDSECIMEGVAISVSDSHVIVESQEGRKVFHITDVKLNDVTDDIDIVEAQEETTITEESKPMITIEGESIRKEFKSSNMQDLKREFIYRLCEVQPRNGLDRCNKTHVNIKYKNFETSIRLDLDSKFDILTDFEELIISFLQRRITEYTKPDCILPDDTIKEELKQNIGVLSYFK